MDPDEGPRLRVIVGDERGRRVPTSAGLARWLARVAPARAAGTISVALVSDSRVRRLNREFRGIDRATDVLSFPVAGELPGHVRSRRSTSSARTHSRVDLATPSSRAFLGDIVIARGIARRQARAAGHSEPIEWRVLALHGLLHLLGYDHERDHGQMAATERRLRRKGGLRDGLIERTRSR